MRIAVIADDITGANDTGVQFAKAGIDTLVLLPGGYRSYIPGEEAVVLDTDSRALPAAQARDTVAQVCRWVQEHNFDVVFKKIDSTLRGNVGAELDAALEHQPGALALVAPAMPKNGRKTIGGYHLLNDIPLALTEIARDPRSPVTESHLPTLLRQGTDSKVGLVDFATVARGAAAIITKLTTLSRQGCRVVCCDVCFDRDLAAIVEAGLAFSQPVLWVGAAGLGEYLARALAAQRKQTAVPRPVVVFAGSVSEVTRRQVATLEDGGMASLVLRGAALLQPAAQVEAYISEIATALRRKLAEGQDVVVVSAADADDVQNTLAVGTRLGLTSAAVGEQVAAAFGRLAATIIDANPAGLVLTGGDTAAAVCRALWVHGVWVHDEVAFGIPLGEIALPGGRRLPVVTKAGAFGNPQALLAAVQALHEWASLRT